MNEKIAQLKRTLDDSTYTAALYGSGTMKESGFTGIKKQDKTYDIENWYGYGVEEMYISVFCNTRSERFFELYKEEMLRNTPGGTASGPALATIGRAEKLQRVTDSNIYDRTLRGGCRHAINFHGSTYQNQCLRCKRKYLTGYIAGVKQTPICRDCNIPIRPMISLTGEMVDSQSIARTTEEIIKADTLLLSGTTLASEVSCQYIQYFTGRNIVIIHRQEHYPDKDTDLVVLDHPMNVLPQLGYREEKTEEQTYFPFSSLTLFQDLGLYGTLDKI